VAEHPVKAINKIIVDIILIILYINIITPKCQLRKNVDLTGFL